MYEMYEERQKKSFGPKKKLCFSRIILSGFWGCPFSPLTENHSGQKPLAELGGATPLEEKFY